MPTSIVYYCAAVSYTLQRSILKPNPYNFVRIHSALRMTPAMAAGVSDRLWEVSDIVALWEAVEPKAGKRGPYTERNIGAL
jgi:hypothetical protein